MTRARVAPTSQANRTAAAPQGSRRDSAWQLATIAAGVYLSLSAWLFFAVRHRNHGQFTYALDDPYIHLALSQGIAHGHYGINAGQFASPSSSIVWPFLLALFARWSAQVYVPLGLNLLAGLATAGLIGAMVAGWPQPPDDEPAVTELWRRRLSAAMLVFIGNLLGLTFIGMEHVLEVLLAGIGALGIVHCLESRRIPTWVLVCAAVAPSVRYESLSIAVALAVALLGQRQGRRAASLLGASLAPLLLFSLFLHHLGLPWLPTSVLVKGGMAAAGGGVGREIVMATASSNSSLAEPHHLLLFALFAILLVLAATARTRERRFALWGATVAAGLHLLVGRFHWFHRYEVYAVFFSALVVLHVTHERPRGLLGWYAMGLLGCSFLYLQAALEVPHSAADVYREEFQMHRFTTEYPTGNIAVNDLGLVSYRRPPGLYVLDLWGLGSVEAARQRNKSTAWLQSEVAAHHVGLVMDYALWFAPPPASWRLLGEICLKDLPVALGDPCVNYYAPDPATADDLQDDFDQFARTLPDGVTVRHPLLPPPPPAAP